MSDAHLGPRLLDLANGALAAADRDACAAHLAGCAACAAELAWLQEQLASAALALPPLQPTTALRSRLNAALDLGGRFSRFVDRVAALFEIDRPAARTLLDRLDDPARWQPSPLPGLWVQPAETSPRFAAAEAQLLRFAPGTRFPLHVHHGVEQLLFVQGRAREDGGRLLEPGDLRRSEAGSRHAFTIREDAECLCIALVEGKLELVGR